MGEERDLAFLEGLLGGQGLWGPGDDAALLELAQVRVGRGAGRRVGKLLATVDPVVEGRHFSPNTAPRDVGQKLVGRNFSDLAAMAALPEAVLVSFVFGLGWTFGRRCALYRAVAKEVQRWGGRWIGGDVAGVEGPSVFTLTAIGRCPSRPIPRNGLKPGDFLHVSGPLGGAPSTKRHLRVEPRLDLAQELSQAFPLHAMIDLSDGLGLDLSRMLLASSRVGRGGPRGKRWGRQLSLGAELFEEGIPQHRSAHKSPLALGPLGSLGAALGDGEDYELCFGLSARASRRLQEDSSFPRVLRQPIGRVIEGAGLVLLKGDGSRLKLPTEGFFHELP
jgi:thiamine-monophosphate kinase